MKNIKDELNIEKIRLEQLHIPEDFEERLGKSLQEKTKNRRKGVNKFVTSRNGLVAAMILVIIFIGMFNYDTLAYYGKSIVGYDELMSSSLKQLNKNYKGQIIDKSYTFKDGTVITLDGIMIDSNKLVAFYSMDIDKEEFENGNDLSREFIKCGEDWMIPRAGTGCYDEQKKKMIWKQEFEPPKSLKKIHEFSFARNNDGEYEEGKIEFTIDKSKAMIPKFKLNMNKRINVAGTTVKIQSITATSMSTIVKGKIRGTLEVALDYLKGEKKPIEGIEIAIFGDGEPIANLSGGFSTEEKGDYFEAEFDALPEKLSLLEVVIEECRVGVEVKVDEKLSKGEEKKNIVIEGNEVTIENVYEKDGNTYVTLTTEKGVLLSAIYLNIDGETVELERTFGGQLERIIDGENKEKIAHTRTLEFKDVGEDLELSVRMITFDKKVDESIKIEIVD
ncbi:DUF4179 domain-containing protein [Oceanirhabdus seepicola]|uniref:DUF4179 domain-containing protein n=1 Tax=Oceanirhabdus seepicola TaxID=2828781 RepID=A0A9J6NVW7_9CLOT|nr:DUF4179 domain-containing protein [Oceanirhabdus seepicola]